MPKIKTSEIEIKFEILEVTVLDERRANIKIKIVESNDRFKIEEIIIDYRSENNV